MNELIELRERFEAIAQSAEQFPVDFDDAWQWVGYSNKGNALRKLQENFQEEEDFCLSKLISKAGRGGHNEVRYFLATDCFKSFCMMAGTPKGKEVRKYYIKIEKAWRTPELVAEQARRLGALPQPEPIAWCVYPFFNKSDASELLGQLIESFDKGLSTREDFRRVVFDKPDTTPHKTPKEIPDDAYGRAVRFLRGDSRRAHPGIAAFADSALIITKSRADFVLTREVYERYSAQNKNPVRRPMFSRHLRLMYPEIGLAQKKVKGVPELVFEGVKFREDE